MANKIKISDTLTTATTSLIGLSQPKISYTYQAPVVNMTEFYNVYDTSPLAQLLINTIPEDTVSEWREWQADGDDVNLIERLEKKFQLRKVLRDWQVFGAIEGESIIYVDDGGDAKLPLDSTKIKLGGIRFIRMLRSRDYFYTAMITDPMSEWYGQPEYYQINTDAATISAQIHPSRVFRWVNNPSPSRETGMPSLVAGLDAIRQYESIIANAGFLVKKARSSVLSMEGLMDFVSDPEEEKKLIARYALYNLQEGNQGLSVLDKDKEKFSTYAYQFGGLDPLIERMQQHVASMWGYPVTRIFDRVGGGIGNTGEVSLKAYYQSIGRRQDNHITPLISRLDEMLVRSALGDYPNGVYYKWRPLESSNPKEVQDIGKIAADTLSTAIAGGFMPIDVATKALINRFTESGCFPGVDLAYEEWIAGGGDMEADESDLVSNNGEDEGEDTLNADQ